MKGYIYSMFRGADPGVGWELTDPIFGRVPTLGACVPNIRRAVVAGDYVFVVSGRVPTVQQYVVGGFRVAEKIDALAAYQRFPENRLCRSNDGKTLGNVIVDGRGDHNALDHHGQFDRRLMNYLVGTDPISLQSRTEIERGRNETLNTLGDLFGKTGQRVHDIIGRCRRLDEAQIDGLLIWLKGLKTSQA